MLWYDVMISTLQKRLQYALLSLVGPSSSFRIESHIGRDISADRAPALVANLFTSSIWAGVIDNLAKVSLIKVGAGLLYEAAQMTL